MQVEKMDQAMLYTLYRDKVFGYIMNRLRNRAESEDLTSEVFLKLYSMSNGFDLERSGAATYVFKVMQSVLIDFHRKKRIICTELEEALNSLIHFDDYGDLNEQLVALDNALETLSEREKEIVILHYYDGLKHIEISKKLGLSYTNERQICHVAIKKLRKEIEKNL